MCPRRRVVHNESIIRARHNVTSQLKATKDACSRPNPPELQLFSPLMITHQPHAIIMASCHIMKHLESYSIQPTMQSNAVCAPAEI